MTVATPRITVLYAVMGRLQEVDLPTLTGMADLKLRWARNRYTTREERPCIALAFVSDTPREGTESYTNTDEMVRELALDIIIDMEVETEASAEANVMLSTPLADFDPSGLVRLSGVLDLVMLSLRQCCQDPLAGTTDLGRKIDWVQDVSVDDDEDLQDNDGRLVGRANVVYRTSSWDPTLLLMRS